ncbi:MAG TPA: DUF4307 domain-containing protein [Thermopolyspora sp.]|jgi:hypothetical protein
MVGNEVGDTAPKPPTGAADNTLRVPVLSAPPVERRPSRLSRGRRLTAYVIIAAFVTVAAAGWGYVMMTMRGDPVVGGQVVSFVQDTPASLTITFEVHKPADRAAACRLRAMDIKQGEVGSREIVIPVGESDVTRTERLETTGEPVSGSIQYCYLVQ